MGNKVVLVTGGSSGIGKTIAKEFALENYSVVVNYNTSKDSALNLVNEILALGKEAIAIKCDISVEEEVLLMVNQIVDKFGKIDVLVNNAGVCFDSLFINKSVESFKNTLNTNVIGTFLVSKYVGQIMYENKFGRIINISSTNGINTYFPMCVDYDASKAAINSLTHNLAVQFAPYVNVNAVAPGFIGTENELKDMDIDFIESEKDKILVKRVGCELDVANLVLFLAGNKSSYINNQIIKIDGGIYGD